MKLFLPWVAWSLCFITTAGKETKTLAYVDSKVQGTDHSV